MLLSMQVFPAISSQFSKEKKYFLSDTSIWKTSLNIKRPIRPVREYHRDGRLKAKMVAEDAMINQSKKEEMKMNLRILHEHSPHC